VPRSANSPVQQLYELAFCLWCLTYELNNFADVRADFAKDGVPVAALVELVSSAPREKIVRVALAALRNLATCSADINPEPDAPRVDSKVFLGEMIACGLMKAIGLLRERQFTDPDVVDDVNALERLLVDNFKEMTRWEVYQNEVETGQLQWGSTHTDAFFKENAKMMEGKDGNFDLIKILISLVSSKDEDVAAIACFDLGEFCRHYPNGRAIAKRLGAKDLAMALIEHDNPELQRHALQCVSKMMVHNWEYVK
jgi:V-type H+-transporting ATPase subunit H